MIIIIMTNHHAFNEVIFDILYVKTWGSFPACLLGCTIIQTGIPIIASTNVLRSCVMIFFHSNWIFLGFSQATVTSSLEGRVICYKELRKTLHSSKPSVVSYHVSIDILTP